MEFSCLRMSPPKAFRYQLGFSSMSDEERELLERLQQLSQDYLFVTKLWLPESFYYRNGNN